MPRHCDSGRIELKNVFHQVQGEMLSHLEVRKLLEHPSACGAATEKQWIELFNRYLPQRYCASSAFVMDADGRRSRQIDIAIYDRFYSPMLLAHESGLHVPAESVYATFEVKHMLNQQWLRDAGEKAASIRRLRRTSVPVPVVNGRRQETKPRRILAGVLSVHSAWTDEELKSRLASVLGELSEEESLDLGCVLSQAGFEVAAARRRVAIQVSTKEEALIFFFIRLVERLRELGNAPAADLMAYARGMKSFGDLEI